MFLENLAKHKGCGKLGTLKLLKQLMCINISRAVRSLQYLRAVRSLRYLSDSLSAVPQSQRHSQN